MISLDMMLHQKQIWKMTSKQLWTRQKTTKLIDGCDMTYQSCCKVQIFEKYYWFSMFHQSHGSSVLLVHIFANHQKHNITYELVFTFKTKLQVCTSFLDFWSFATYTILHIVNMTEKNTHHCVILLAVLLVLKKIFVSIFGKKEEFYSKFK